MSYKQAVANSVTWAYELIPVLLSDLSDADLLVRPVPGANNIAWQLGHLILQERRWIGSQDLGVPFPALPNGFEQQHGDAAASIEPPQGYLTKSEYLNLMAKTHEATMASLATLSDEDLDRPVEGEPAKRVDTLADVFLAFSSNIAVHQGQFIVIRQLLGKPPVYYRGERM
jgi:hypothetical protein